MAEVVERLSSLPSCSSRWIIKSCFSHLFSPVIMAITHLFLPRSLLPHASSCAHSFGEDASQQGSSPPPFTQTAHVLLVQQHFCWHVIHQQYVCVRKKYATCHYTSIAFGLCRMFTCVASRFWFLRQHLSFSPSALVGYRWELFLCYNTGIVWSSCEEFLSCLARLV